jgi:ferritin-like metal-binding protein YciE
MDGDTMATSNDLKTLYEEELGDLWSANDQMQRIVAKMAEQASAEPVKKLLEKSVDGIAKHTATIQSMVEAYGGKKDHCRGMEGLVEEAKKHALDTPLDPEMRDLELIAQYQRMSHYGLAGFGTATAYADVLGLTEDAQKLKQIVSDIYRADEYSSQLAMSAEQSIKG